MSRWSLPEQTTRSQRCAVAETKKTWWRNLDLLDPPFSVLGEIKRLPQTPKTIKDMLWRTLDRRARRTSRRRRRLAGREGVYAKQSDGMEHYHGRERVSVLRVGRGVLMWSSARLGRSVTGPGQGGGVLGNALESTSRDQVRWKVSRTGDGGTFLPDLEIASGSAAVAVGVVDGDLEGAGASDNGGPVLSTLCGREWCEQ